MALSMSGHSFLISAKGCGKPLRSLMSSSRVIPDLARCLQMEQEDGHVEGNEAEITNGGVMFERSLVSLPDNQCCHGDMWMHEDERRPLWNKLMYRQFIVAIKENCDRFSAILSYTRCY